jgi:hypothetical protein
LYALLTSWTQNAVLELHGHVMLAKILLGFVLTKCFAQGGGNHIICLRVRTCRVSDPALESLLTFLVNNTITLKPLLWPISPICIWRTSYREVGESPEWLLLWYDPVVLLCLLNINFVWCVAVYQVVKQIWHHDSQTERAKYHELVSYSGGCHIWFTDRTAANFRRTGTLSVLYRTLQNKVHRSDDSCLWSLPSMSMRSALFWGITQYRMVILYRRFGTTYPSHLQGSRSHNWASDYMNFTIRNMHVILSLKYSSSDFMDFCFYSCNYSELI